MTNTDVTEQLKFANPDDEVLPIIRCICGKVFDYWKFYISIYEDTPHACPNCGRSYFFRNDIRIYLVED